MTSRTVALSEIREQRLADVLRDVATRDEVLTVQQPEGARAAIEPLPRLEPLPKLKCIVPEGWKDAING